ncbi:MAG: CoA pyrophosphatase [Gammaproteobacteria bacterium]|nr:CoA pyrophosphatase [Gammaproteobacteria bacterium]
MIESSVEESISDELRHSLLRSLALAHLQPGSLQRWSWPNAAASSRPNAAILMPFYSSADDQNRLLLTRRARHLRRHAGQMSFPGGVAEPDDANLLQTAIRETEEETGIRDSYIEPLGKLGEMITISGYRLHVYVAWLRNGFEISPDPNEVEAVYLTDAAKALHPQTFHWQQRETPAGMVPMPELQLEQQRVWGITAIIIWHLSTLLSALDRT